MSKRFEDLERLSSGIDGLDTILKGGFVRGAAYIVNGPPGAGKTILANQFCFRQAAEGRKALYVSLLAEAHDRMMAFMQPMTFYNARHIPEHVYYMSAYAALQQEGLPGVLKFINRETRQHKADAVILDGLFVIHDTASSEREFRRFVHELQGQASITGATVLILTNQSRQPSAPEHTMVDGWIELLDEVEQARAMRSIIVRKQRGDGYLRGQHAFRITDQGLKVFPRIEALLNQEPGPSALTEHVSTGIPAFDAMTGGGYPAASSTLLLGPTGAGKTSLGLEFLSCSTPESPGVLFGFYESSEILRAKARRIGIDLDGLLESGAVEIVWQSFAENLADELGDRLLAAVKRRGARRVFVDGIDGFRKALVFSDRLPLLLNALNNALKDADVASVYSMELPTLSLPDDLHTHDVSAMVDNVIILHYAKRDGAFCRNLSILKIRDSDFDPFPQEFYISDEGVQFGERPAGRPGTRDDRTGSPSRPNR